MTLAEKYDMLLKLATILTAYTTNEVAKDCIDTEIPYFMSYFKDFFEFSDEDIEDGLDKLVSKKNADYEKMIDFAYWYLNNMIYS